MSAILHRRCPAARQQRQVQLDRMNLSRNLESTDRDNCARVSSRSSLIQQIEVGIAQIHVASRRGCGKVRLSTESAMLGFEGQTAQKEN
jgi:hypothetical protein